MTPELKPYPAYKDSGVEWLGRVPSHWAVERLKDSLANIVDQEDAESVPGGTAIAMENVESWTGRVVLADSPSSFDSQLKRFRSGDVLFGKLRPYLAKVVRLTSDGLCVGEFLVLRPRHGSVLGPYFEQLLRSKPIIDAVTASTHGAKMPRADLALRSGECRLRAVRSAPGPHSGRSGRPRCRRRLRRGQLTRNKQAALYEQIGLKVELDWLKRKHDLVDR